MKIQIIINTVFTSLEDNIYLLNGKAIEYKQSKIDLIRKLF